MKKLIILLFGMLFSLTFGISFAADFNAGENLNITIPVNNNYYVAGGKINIDTNIGGDLIIAGGQISIKGNVQDDILAAGGQIDIQGNVGDDIRVSGGSVTVSSNIGGDLVVAGGEVFVVSGVIISGDLVATAGKINFAGTVNGNTKIAGGELILGGRMNRDTELYIKGNKSISILSGAQIAGKLTYSSSEKNENLERIVSSQNIEFKQIENGAGNEIMEFIGGYILYRILFLSIFGIILIFALHKFFGGVGNILALSPWKSLLYGFLIYALTPFLILVLLVSVIGIPLGIFLIFVYIFMYVFYKLMNVVVFSGLLINRLGGSENVVWWKKVLIVIGFAILFGIVSGIDIIAAFFAMGAILIKKFEIVKKDIL